MRVPRVQVHVPMQGVTLHLPRPGIHFRVKHMGAYDGDNASPLTTGLATKVSYYFTHKPSPNGDSTGLAKSKCIQGTRVYTMYTAGGQAITLEHSGHYTMEAQRQRKFVR